MQCQDLKLDSRPLLQVPSSDTSGIREIKVIHTNTKSKFTSLNGVKRFNNFQNSTSSSFDKSEAYTSSGSESGGSQASQVMQKSFKQQMIGVKLVNS